MFAKLKRSLGDKFESSSSSPTSPPPPSSGDRMEDGFVIVGETPDEKTIICPDDPRNKEPAPQYETLQHTARQSHQPSPTVPHPCPIQYTATASDPETMMSSSPTYSGIMEAISDIPFRFHASVASALGDEKLMQDISDVAPKIFDDLSDYHYDFAVEREVLDS